MFYQKKTYEKLDNYSKVVILSHTFLNLIKQDVATKSQLKNYCWKTRLLLKPGTRPWILTLKNLDPEKPGPRKNWIRKNLYPEKPGPRKTCTRKKLDTKKSEL